MDVIKGVVLLFLINLLFLRYIFRNIFHYFEFSIFYIFSVL